MNMAAADDDFEFDAVPKFMDFQNDENDGALLDRSAFFNGDGPIHPTPGKPRTEAATPLFIEPAKSKTTPPTFEKIPVPAVLAEKNNFEEKKKPLGSNSDLALFNPAASRLHERARRRSQQIQVQEEKPKPAAPAPKVSVARRPLQKTPQKNQPFTRSHEVPAALAEKKNLEEEKKKKLPLGSTSNLALFNPGASRLAERARRRSQQIQVRDEPPKPASKNPLRRPIPQTPPKHQPFTRSRDIDPRLQASIDRLSMPKIRQSATSEALKSAAGTPKKTARPILRRQTDLQHAGTTTSAPPTDTPDKPEAFKQKLRSYKPPTGKTPAKTLTVPKPYPFHRSTSQCRDADAKPFKIGPKILDSVNRLSAPKKRESAANGPSLRRK